MGKKISGSVKAQRTITDIIVHVFLVVVSIVWLIPFIWLVAHSFRGGVDRGQFSATFFPTQWTLDNYYEPGMEEAQRQKLLRGWHKAVGRSLAWAEPDEA